MGMDKRVGEIDRTVRIDRRTGVEAILGDEMKVWCVRVCKEMVF